MLAVDTRHIHSISENIIENLFVLQMQYFSLHSQHSQKGRPSQIVEQNREHILDLLQQAYLIHIRKTERHEKHNHLLILSLISLFKESTLAAQIIKARPSQT